MPSSHLILCRPLLLLPTIPPSIRFFSNESTLRIRWPKYWSFSFSISPSKQIPGLISFTMDWLDLPCSPRDSRVFSNTTVQKHQFFGIQLSSQFNSRIHAWPLESSPRTMEFRQCSTDSKGLLFHIVQVTALTLWAQRPFWNFQKKESSKENKVKVN